jgi:hypothetical protein
MTGEPHFPRGTGLDLQGASSDEAPTTGTTSCGSRAPPVNRLGGFALLLVAGAVCIIMKTDIHQRLGVAGLIGLADIPRKIPDEKEVEKFMRLVEDDKNFIETEVMLTEWTGLTKMINTDGRYALQVAVDHCDSAGLTVQLLLEHAADGPSDRFTADAQECLSKPQIVAAQAKKLVDDLGNTHLALCKAISSRKDLAIVKELIESLGANPSTGECDDGATPLHLACEKGDLKAVDLLIREGADVNAENDHGATPLTVASFAGQEDVIATLIEHKAEVNQVSNGWSPLGAAVLAKQHKAAKLLSSYGAECSPPDELYCLSWEA